MPRYPRVGGERSRLDNCPPIETWTSRDECAGEPHAGVVLSISTHAATFRNALVNIIAVLSSFSILCCRLISFSMTCISSWTT